MAITEWRFAGAVGIAALGIMGSRCHAEEQKHETIAAGELPPLGQGQPVVPTAAPGSSAPTSSPPVSQPVDQASMDGQDSGVPPVPARLDLSDAVVLTLLRHPEVSRANAALARGRADLGAAKSAWYPQVSYQAISAPTCSPAAIPRV